jgi:hypothetical protein
VTGLVNHSATIERGAILAAGLTAVKDLTLQAMLSNGIAIRQTFSGFDSKTGEEKAQAGENLLGF